MIASASTVHKSKKIDKINWTSSFGFEVYGVRVGIRANSNEVLSRVRERLPLVFPIGLSECEFDSCEHIFSVRWAEKRSQSHLFFKDDEESHRQKYSDTKLDLLDSKLRITVAEFAVGYAFIHAGAVRYGDTAMIIPAKSFSGKTTLVAEFAKLGLQYYSDEYAVIDEKGMLHPYPKQLSMRGIISDYEQVEIDVEEYGGIKGVEPVKIGYVLVSKFRKRSRFAPQLLSSGEGIIECIANSVSIRHNPEFVLKVLGNVMNDAKVIKTGRSEAVRFAPRILEFIDQIEL